MSEEQSETVRAESGAQIPVRMENDHPTYTDTEGKQLATGHDISPGTEERWGLGKDVEHNPALAHDMAREGDVPRRLAVNFREEAEDYNNLGTPAAARFAAKRAKEMDEWAERREQEVKDDHLIEHGLPISDEKYKEREEELLGAMQMQAEGLKETIAELSSSEKITSHLGLIGKLMLSERPAKWLWGRSQAKAMWLLTAPK